MQLKTKLFAPLFVLLMMGMANSAYASLVCAASVENLRPRDTINAVTAVAGDVRLDCNATDASPITEATISIAYGVPITNSRNQLTGTAHFISLSTTGATGGLTNMNFDAIGGTQGAQNGILAAAGAIILNLPAYTPVAGSQGFVVLRNVLLSVAGGIVSGGNVRANINVASAGNTVSISGAPVEVITQILPSINSTTAAPGLASGTLTAQFTSTGGTISATRSNFTIIATENYIDAWRTPGNYFAPQPGTANNSTAVTFTFTGMLPGSLIQNCIATIAPAGPVLVLTGSGIAGSNGQASLDVEFAAGATNNAAIEAVTLTCGAGTSAPAYGVGISSGPATSNISFNVSQTPIGVNYPGAMGTIGGVAPRFLAGTTVAGVVVIGFTGATTGQTTMLIPWATGSGAAAPPAGTFDTGIVIANTTKNAPGFLTPAEGGATPSTGNVSFTFFPMDGSAQFTITPTTGFGLTAGAIPAGGSFIANVSEILKAGGQTGTFTGYMFVQANFTHAHGTAFVYGGAQAGNRITSFTPVLEIGNPVFQPRNLVGTTPNVELTVQ